MRENPPEMTETRRGNAGGLCKGINHVSAQAMKEDMWMPLFQSPTD